MFRVIGVVPLSSSRREELEGPVCRGGVTERTHSGFELLSGLRQEGLTISDDLFHQVCKIDRSYIDSRYPSGVAGAQSVMAFVQSNLT